MPGGVEDGFFCIPFQVRNMDRWETLEVKKGVIRNFIRTVSKLSELHVNMLSKVIQTEGELT